MTPAVAFPAFVGGASVSLSSGWLLASRLERVAERIGLSEALLGVVAALAADAPEITAAVAAISAHRARVGAGVVLGSSIFNLAALLGLGALVAGRISLHRRVVALAGGVTFLVACCGLLVLAAPLLSWIGLLFAAVIVGLYLGVLGTAHRGLGWLRVPPKLRSWTISAVTEEEEELDEVLRPLRGRPIDTVIAVVALVAVVGSSVLMERSASSLGDQYGIPEIVVGALVLGWVTGAPNAVASTYLARKGRGAAALSTALNTNNFNVLIGLLVPAAVVGLGGRSGETVMLGAWCVAMTVLTLGAAYRSRGAGRRLGAAVVLIYLAFTATVVVVGVS